MKSLRLVLSLIAVSVVAASAAYGQANRTWVSHTGKDSNSCAETSPCLTFAGAYAKTNTGGEIDALDGGDFGPLTITHSITIDGGSNQLATIYVGTAAGITVNASASTVTLRNLSILGSGQTNEVYGINVTSVQTLHIEHCSVANIKYGIWIQTSSTTVNAFIEDTVVRDSFYALLPYGPSNVSISGSHFLNNVFGVLLRYASLNASIANSDMSGNSYGIYSIATGSMFVTNTIVANNQYYGIYSCGSAVTLSNVSLFNNADGAVSDCTNFDTFNNNPITGTVTSTTPIPLQ
jgi:nitrous oxidase accessory protein NosD